MTATCGSTKRMLIGTCALSCFVFLICSTFTGVVAEPRITSPLPQPTSKQRSLRNQTQNGNARHKSSYHRPLTPEQKADQNLQFMLSLYRSAAEPDGRLKQYRKFGSNTVRLLKPSVSSLHYLTASREHHYTFTVEYSLDSLPLEQLIRASFLHFRSSSSSSWGPGAFHLPPCRARVASLGVLHHADRPPPEESVPLQLHHQWTETDVTAHVSRHILQRTNQTSLTLMAQYRCTDPGSTDQAGDPSWWSQSSKAPSPSGRRMMMMRRLRGRRRRRRRRWSHTTGDVSGYHLEAPSLLLYLEERREGQDWMKELLAGEDESAAQLWPPPSSAFRRHRHRPRRSAIDPPEEFPPGAKAFSSAVLKVVAVAAAAAASSSSSPNSSSSASSSASPWSGDTYEAVPGMPNYRRKTSLPRDRCRLRSLRLSFEALGLGHYFIAPPVYNPRYCQGECPSVLHHGYHAPNHAIIQTVMRELGVSDDVPAPSCVPYRYMPMSVLVRNKKRVEYRELEDMIAESCTCR